MRVTDWFEYHATTRPSVDFLRQDGVALSYAAAEALANRWANAMLARGLSIGDRIGYLSANRIDMGVMFIAAAKAGVAPVLLNHRLAPPELAWILQDSAPRIVFAQGAEHVATIESIRAGLPHTTLFVATDMAAAPPGWMPLPALLEPAPATRPGLPVAADDIFYLIYTSGTTGHPKGVMISHRNIIAHVEQSMVASSASRAPGTRALVVTPLSHAAGALRIVTAALNGGCVVLLEHFDPQHFVATLERERIATCNMVPAILRRILDEVPDLATRALALQVIYYGAAPIDVPLLRRALAVFRCDLIQGYGLTESTGGIAYLNEHDHRRALDGRPELLRSTGRAVVLAEIRIVDAEDRDVPPGTVGELVVRGPNVMLGYWRNPAATAEALRGGWLHSGDAASMDAEGYITLHDRMKDMVVTGGSNVYPREVENALAEHPAIAESAVIGIPDPRWGEALLAVCVLRDGQDQPSAAELIAHCRARIGGYKVPRRYEFTDSLPRNAAGKVLKRALRLPYWDAESRAIG
jgi:fatty-acyl-CoA synthase